MEFDLSFNVPSAVGAQQSQGPRYASDDGIVYSISAEECLFQSRRTGENHVMTRDVFMAMTQTRGFRTLDAHATMIAQAQPELKNQRGAIRQVLDLLVKRGIMVAEDEVLAALKAPEPAQASAFSALVIRSCERPDLLQRLLTSLREDAAFQATDIDVLVVDDSREEASHARNRQICQSMPARYFGPEQQREWLNRLADSAAVPQEVAQWLAGPRQEKLFSGGRALNLISLLMAGSRYALLDDDYVYQALADEDARLEELAFAPDDGSRVRFGSAYPELVAATSAPTSDLLDLHRSLAGQPLAALLSDERWQRQSIDRLSMSDFRHVSGDGRVLLTHQGVWGHARSDKPFWLYALDSQSRSDLTAEREAYLQLRSAPLIRQTAMSWSLHRNPRFLPLTVDGSAWMPPTLPEARAEDLLFNTLVMALHPGGMALEAPFALQHGREEPHAYTDRDRQKAMTPGLAILLSDFVEARIGQCEAAGPEDRFTWILNQVTDLLAASEHRRELFLREYLGWVRGDFIGQLQQQMAESAGLPVYWQADAHAMIKVNAKALLENERLELEDTPDGLSGNAAVDDTFRRMGQWEQAARHWPSLYRAAFTDAGLQQRLTHG